jgi:outer membrane cobalamin receptor
MLLRWDSKAWKACHAAVCWYISANLNQAACSRYMTRLIALLVLTTAFGGATPSSAQTPPPSAQAAPPDAARFATDIVVTPERGETLQAQVPAATVVLDRAALTALPVVHPAEALSFIPGFNVMQAEFHAGRPVMSARGFFGGGEAEYVQVLVDGVSIADTESGLIDWSLVPASSITRIEAVRGPGASMYGDAAVGGVIQILTERPANAGRVTLSGGSFGSFTADGTYGRRARGLGFNVSGVARRTAGALAHSGGDHWVGAGSVEGGGDGLTWRWNGSGDQRQRDDPGSLRKDALALDRRASDAAFRFDRVDRHGFSTAFTLRQASRAWRPQLRVYASGRDEDLIRTILLAPGLADTHARTLSSLTAGGSADAEHTFAGRRGPVVRLGLDIAREQLDTQYNRVSGSGGVGAQDGQANGVRIRAGAFASASFAPVPRVRVTGAVRWDDVDDGRFAGTAAMVPQKTAWSPRAGAVVQLRDQAAIVLFAQASRAFKAPTLDQLFDPRPYPDFRGGTFTISSRTLTPQTATNVETGISGRGVVRWSALVYRMDVTNEIDFDLRTFSYANIGRSRHVGTELEAEGLWWKRVRPSVAYALALVTDRSAPDQDAQLKNVPRHLMSLGATVELPWATSLLARYRRTAGSFVDDANAIPIIGPSSLDLRVRRAAGRHVLFLDVINAANTLFEEYGYTLTDFQGRTVPYVYAGAPRAVRAGVTVAF